MAQQSEVALRLKRLREKTGLSVRDVAGALGRASSSYSSYEDKYKKRFLPMDLVMALVPIFEAKGVTPSEVLALGGADLPNPRQKAAALARPSDDGAMASPLRILRPAARRPGKDLPIYSSAEGGPSGMLINPEPFDWTTTPESLAGVSGAFAVYVFGMSMEPEYEHGSLVLINPTLPPARNEDVLLTTAPDAHGDMAALVKLLHGWNDRVWHVEQWTPGKTYDLERKTWVKANVIVGKLRNR